MKQASHELRLLPIMGFRYGEEAISSNRREKNGAKDVLPIFQSYSCQPTDRKRDWNFTHRGSSIISGIVHLVVIQTTSSSAVCSISTTNAMTASADQVRGNGSSTPFVCGVSLGNPHLDKRLSDLKLGAMLLSGTKINSLCVPSFCSKDIFGVPQNYS
jgi:hypothetical protein